MSSVSSVRRTLSRAAVAGLALALLSCDKPTKPIPGSGDPENIVRITVKLVNGATTVQSVRVDPDGSQLPQPVGAASATLALTKGVTYTGSIGLLNDLDPKKVVDIAAEVADEANFHRFFYTFVGCTGVVDPDPATFDKDTQATPQPVGLTFTAAVAAGAATTASCTLHIELHHFETNKGDGTGSNFETDLSIDFPVSISP